MLDTVITVDNLMDLAGSKVFWRGESYFSGNAVGRVRVMGDRIKARVQGTEVYQVELWDDGGQLGYDCTCPHAADGYFCKHCVAVGLAWIGGAADRPDVDDEDGTAVSRTPTDPWKLIQSYLETQPQETLVSRLMEIARRDDRLYQSLLLKAERGRSGSDQAKRFRRAIDEATRGAEDDWQSAEEFAEDLGAVIDALEELLEPQSATLLIDLTEHAIERAEKAMQHIEDDEEGAGVEVVERLGELHQKACRLAPPDPVELAERLFRLEGRQDLQFVSFSPDTYSEALGERGLKRYRELVEAQWRDLSPPDAGRYDPQYARLKRLMECLARLDGNVEELVAIRARDLDSSYSYLDIAEIWTQAGEPERALEWAERGLAAFPENTSNRLRDFLVAAYLERGRRDEALALTWVQFDEQPELSCYQKLKAVAERLGIWPEQRERALKRLEEYIQTEAAKTSRWRPRTSEPDYSSRVEIALWEEDPEAGLEAVGRGTCDSRLLIRLAGQLEAGQPDEAMKLYRRIIQPTIEQTNSRAYEEAVKLIRRVGELMKQQERLPEFREYVEGLRARYRAKRNFIKLLDTVRTA
ncbi:SWIM zinc finger family protein [Allochromatium vinosum]|uniref:Zinc finger SWIM domain protein n=1 Tax=Allochromatium vinosum (strain ATCC 17899 / DSM 180 / NBRC 103801 / NCIMB 10441 / D) TaxID=572477 RepID=D3RMH4_ALLVD|nr:DUF6880 family protein [Allochromatium vinosum]ADC61232.1 zinc finger SWIM domain protein [Allochromatium vinosum DSM 180]MBK1655514.1 hypothetical protein [Allochromatium vinosum]